MTATPSRGLATLNGALLAFHLLLLVLQPLPLVPLVEAPPTMRLSSNASSCVAMTHAGGGDEEARQRGLHLLGGHDERETVELVPSAHENTLSQDAISAPARQPSRPQLQSLSLHTRAVDQRIVAIAV